MKRILYMLLAMVLLCKLLPVTGQAAELDTIYFDDGSFAIIEIASDESRASGSKTGSKSYTYYNSDNEIQWKVTLTGSFTYTGTNSTCISSDINIMLYNSNCYVVSQNAGKEDNIARGSVTIGYKFLGITVEKKSASLTLNCDANGNLS